MQTRASADRPRTGPAGLALVLALGLAACGSDGPSGPGASGNLEVTPADVAFHELQQGTGVTARLGARTTTRPELQVVAERRWLHDVPVLDPYSLSVARLEATAPGSVELRVSAFGRSATISVRVEPHGPLVMYVAGGAWLTSNVELTLRGYRLHQDLGEITIAGQRADILARDSASVQLQLPDLPVPFSCGVRSDTIRVAGAAVLAPLVGLRAQGTLLALDVGAARAVSDEELACLVLPADTRYALAYYDPTLVERARTAYEGRGDGLNWLTVDIVAGDDGAGPVPEASAAAPRAGAVQGGARAGDIIRVPAGSALLTDYPSPHLRATPWTVGEEFPVEPSPGWGIEARVQRIYGGRYVLATQADLGGDTVQAFVQVFDSIMPGFLRETVPFYQAVFSERHPVTSSASDQLLVLVGRSCFAGFAIEREDVQEARSAGWVTLGACWVQYTPRPYDYLDNLFNHELAHIWSFIYAYDQLGERGLGGTLWGLEGVATLMAQEVVRRRLGIGILSNYDARGKQHAYALSLVHPGTLFNGYNNSASFLRDLVVRGLRRGESYESALRAVARGAVDGWYGYTGCCEEWWAAGHGTGVLSSAPSVSKHAPAARSPLKGPRSRGASAASARLPGLFARMRALDPEWEPEHAVLLWTLAHAIDDRTTNPELQVHSFHDAIGTARDLSPAHYWAPDAVVTPQSSPALVLREGGNSGYSYLHNDDGIGVYRIRSYEGAPRLRWLLARYQ